jgi:hypothetical protein
MILSVVLTQLSALASESLPAMYLIWWISQGIIPRNWGILTFIPQICVLISIYPPYLKKGEIWAVCGFWWIKSCVLGLSEKCSTSSFWNSFSANSSHKATQNLKELKERIIPLHAFLLLCATCPFMLSLLHLGSLTLVFLEYQSTGTYIDVAVSPRICMVIFIFKQNIKNKRQNIFFVVEMPTINNCQCSKM